MQTSSRTSTTWSLLWMSNRLAPAKSGHPSNVIPCARARRMDADSDSNILLSRTSRSVSTLTFSSVVTTPIASTYRLTDASASLVPLFRQFRRLCPDQPATGKGKDGCERRRPARGASQNPHASTVPIRGTDSECLSPPVGGPTHFHELRQCGRQLTCAGARLAQTEIAFILLSNNVTTSNAGIDPNRYQLAPRRCIGEHRRLCPNPVDAICVAVIHADADSDFTGWALSKAALDEAFAPHRYFPHNSVASIPAFLERINLLDELFTAQDRDKRVRRHFVIREYLLGKVHVPCVRPDCQCIRVLICQLHRITRPSRSAAGHRDRERQYRRPGPGSSQYPHASTVPIRGPDSEGLSTSLRRAARLLLMNAIEMSVARRHRGASSSHNRCHRSWYESGSFLVLNPRER